MSDARLVEESALVASNRGDGPAAERCRYIVTDLTPFLPGFVTFLPHFAPLLNNHFHTAPSPEAQIALMVISTHAHTAMTSEGPGQPGSLRPPPKKNFFRKPAWATAAANASAPILEDDDPFSRSRDTYAQIKEQEARKREVKAAEDKRAQTEEQERQKTEQERRTRTDSDLEEDENDTPKKRVRLSDQSEGYSGDYNIINSDDINLSASHGEPPDDRTRSQSEVVGVPQSEPSKNGWLPIELTNTSNVVDLMENDDEALLETNHDRSTPATPALSVDHVVSGSREPSVSPSLAQEYSASYPSAEPDAAAQTFRTDSSSKPSPTAEPICSPLPQVDPLPVPDPVLRILITSRMPDTSPLIVARKSSQRLKEVRLAWCAKQGFDEQTTTSVFMTYRRRRLFDLTTCRSLGVRVNELGEVYIKGQDQFPGDENAQLHMEVVTQQMFDDDKKAREQKAKSPEIEAQTADEEVSQPLAGTKIVLKAQGFEEYKLIVKPVSIFGFARIDNH